MSKTVDQIYFTIKNDIQGIIHYSPKQHSDTHTRLYTKPII